MDSQAREYHVDVVAGGNRIRCHDCGHTSKPWGIHVSIVTAGRLAGRLCENCAGEYLASLSDRELEQKRQAYHAMYREAYPDEFDSGRITEQSIEQEFWSHLGRTVG